jgi:Flp pilus assembly protein TadG
MFSITAQKRHERGAATIEFALAAMFLLMLISAVFEFGRTWSELEVINGAAREGARLAAVCDDCDDGEVVRSQVVAAAAPFSVNSDSISIAVTGGGASCGDGSGERTVTVSWSQPLDIDIFGVPVPAIPDADIRGVFRCE